MERVIVGIIVVIAAIYLFFLAIAGVSASVASLFIGIALISEGFATRLGLSSPVGWSLLWSIIGFIAAATLSSVRLPQEVPSAPIAVIRQTVKSNRIPFFLMATAALAILPALPHLQKHIQEGLARTREEQRLAQQRERQRTFALIQQVTIGRDVSGNQLIGANAALRAPTSLVVYYSYGPDARFGDSVVVSLVGNGITSNCQPVNLAAGSGTSWCKWTSVSGGSYTVTIQLNGEIVKRASAYVSY